MHVYEIRTKVKYAQVILMALCQKQMLSCQQNIEKFVKVIPFPFDQLEVVSKPVYEQNGAGMFTSLNGMYSQSFELR